LFLYKIHTSTTICIKEKIKKNQDKLMQLKNIKKNQSQSKKQSWYNLFLKRKHINQFLNTKKG
jgi:hypothetical protein